MISDFDDSKISRRDGEIVCKALMVVCKLRKFNADHMKIGMLLL